MSLLFNMFVIVFHPRSKHLLILWLQTMSAVILDSKKIKYVTVSAFPHLFAMKWWDQMPCCSFFEYWVLGQVFHSSFIFIKRLFSSSLLTVIKVVSSAYLRLLILLQAVLIPACEHPAWHFTWCTLYRSLISRVTINRLTYPFASLETVHCSMFSTNCCFLSCIQISQEVGKMIWYSHLFKNFPLFIVMHTDEGFSIVSEAEVYSFLNPLSFSMVQWTLAIWSLIPLPFLNPACTSGIYQFTYCWSLAWRIWAWSC